MYTIASRFTFRIRYRDYVERERERALIALVEIDIQRAISARPFGAERSERERRGGGEREIREMHLSGRQAYRMPNETRLVQHRAYVEGCPLRAMLKTVRYI